MYNVNVLPLYVYANVTSLMKFPQDAVLWLSLDSYYSSGPSQSKVKPLLQAHVI